MEPLGRPVRAAHEWPGPPTHLAVPGDSQCHFLPRAQWGGVAVAAPRLSPVADSLGILLAVAQPGAVGPTQRRLGRGCPPAGRAAGPAQCGDY